MHLICAQLQLFLLCPWNLNAWMRELKSNLHYQQRKANLLFQSVLWKGWPSTKKYILRLFFLGSWNPNKDIEAFLLSLSFWLRKKFEKIGLQQKQRSIYIHTYIMIIYWALLFEDRSSKSLSQWERHEEKGGYTSTYIYIAFHIHIHIHILYIYTYILYKYLVIDLIVVLCLDSGLNSTKCPPLLSISIYIYLSVLVDLSNSLSWRIVCAHNVLCLTFFFSRGGSLPYPTRPFIATFIRFCYFHRHYLTLGPIDSHHFVGSDVGYRAFCAHICPCFESSSSSFISLHDYAYPYIPFPPPLS